MRLNSKTNLSLSISTQLAHQEITCNTIRLGTNEIKLKQD